MLSLRTTSQDHHARLMPHVDRLAAIAEMIGQEDCASIHLAFEDEYQVIVGQLVPHMATIESTLYSELERVMGGRHSMAPMRAEHETMRRLIEVIGRYRTHVADCRMTTIEALALRRALFRLYTILKVHLAEEELYLGVLEQNLTTEQKDQLARGLDHAMAQPL